MSDGLGPVAIPAGTDGVEIFRGNHGKTRYFATISQIFGIGSSINPTFGTVTCAAIAFTGAPVVSVATASTHKLQVYMNGVPYSFLLVADGGG
jgi:hypothetical protein